MSKINKYTVILSVAFEMPTVKARKCENNYRRKIKKNNSEYSRAILLEKKWTKTSTNNQSDVDAQLKKNE